MELGAKGRHVGALGPEKLERLGVHQELPLALQYRTPVDHHRTTRLKVLGERSTSDVPSIINDRGWHYKSADVVLYHLYDKYAWLQTRESSLANIVTGL